MERLDEMGNAMDNHIKELKTLDSNYDTTIEENIIFNRKLFDIESRIIRYYVTYHILGMRDLKRIINLVARIININNSNMSHEDRVDVVENIFNELRMR